MTRTRVRWPVIILVSMALSVGFLAGRASGGSAVGGASVRTHIVRHGDTLWEIARAEVGHAGDPRPVVEQIATLNGLANAALDPGTELILPARS